MRTTNYWQELGEDILNQPLDYVVFSIDGLADTNHIYRRGAVWDKIVENAEAFIKAGGSAHWDMLVYQHNQHQVDSAEQFNLHHRTLTDAVKDPFWETDLKAFKWQECKQKCNKNIVNQEYSTSW